MENPKICIPQNDKNLRYVLGQNGKNNILVICLNPSTATAVKHDGTTDNIEKIARVNGFDGWILFNLSPQRTPHPHKLDKDDASPFFEENLKHLMEYVNNPAFGIQNVWLAWGNNIHSPGFPYLKTQAIKMLEQLAAINLKYWCIKETTKKHPFHPAKQAVNRYVGKVEHIRFMTFGVEDYLKKLKN
jgi:hypothetical protein